MDDTHYMWKNCLLSSGKPQKYKSKFESLGEPGLLLVVVLLTRNSRVRFNVLLHIFFPAHSFIVIDDIPNDKTATSLDLRDLFG
jgi:hypothetical protein